jgi:acyl CoA:acetate/3-ketoacid CoA transferase beta subunit
MKLQERIAARAVTHIPGGAVVNLGIGIPTIVADHLPMDSVALQTENGLLGVGPTPGPGEADPDLVHAGQATGDRPTRSVILRQLRLLRHDPRGPR